MRTSKKLLALLLAVIMVVGLVMPAGANAAADFPDYEQTSSYHITAVDALVHLDLMQGHGDTGLLAPQGTLTRAEAVTFIQRLATGNVLPPAVTHQIFSDVHPGQWHAHFITWAYQNNIVIGDDVGTFRPDAPVTNVEFAAMVLRAMGYDRNNEFAANWPNAVTAQATNPQSPVFHGLVNFQYNAPARREQAAQMVFNALPAPMVVWNAMANAYQFLLLGGAVDPTGILRYQTLGNRGWGFLAPHQHHMNAVQVGLGAAGNNYIVGITGNPYDSLQEAPFDIAENVSVTAEHIGHYVAPYVAGGGISGQAPGVVTLRIVSSEIVVARGTSWANAHAQIGLGNAVRRANSGAVPVMFANQQVTHGASINLNIAASAADPRNIVDTWDYDNNTGEFNLLRAQNVRYVIHGNRVAAVVVNPTYTTVVNVSGPASNRTIAFPHGATANGPIAINQGPVGGNFSHANHTLRNNSSVDLNVSGQHVVNARWTGNTTLELTDVEVIEGRIVERHNLPGGTADTAHQFHRFVVGTRVLAYSNVHGAPLLKNAMTEAQRLETRNDFAALLVGMTAAQLSALPAMSFFVNATNGRVFAVTSSVGAGGQVGIITNFVHRVSTENNMTVNHNFADLLTSTGAIVQRPVGDNQNTFNQMLHATTGGTPAVRTIHQQAYPIVIYTRPDAQGFSRVQEDEVPGRNPLIWNGATTNPIHTNNIGLLDGFGIPLQTTENTQFIYLQWNAAAGEWREQHTVVGRHPGTIAPETRVGIAVNHDQFRDIHYLTDVFVFAPYMPTAALDIFFLPYQPQNPMYPIVHESAGRFYYGYVFDTGLAPTEAPPLVAGQANRAGIRVTEAYTGPFNVFVQRVRTGTDQYELVPLTDVQLRDHARIWTAPAGSGWTSVAHQPEQFQNDTATPEGVLVTGTTNRVHINRYGVGETRYTMSTTVRPDASDLVPPLPAPTNTSSDGHAWVVLTNPVSGTDRDHVAVLFLLNTTVPPIIPAP